MGVDRRRSLPPYASETFEISFHGSAPAETLEAGGQKRVVLFHDTFMNYHEPEVGVAATRLLEAAGYEVILAK